MAAEKRNPVRRSPLDGLNPIDFTATWPHGRLRVPEQVVAYGLPREQAQHLLAGINELKELVLDYEEHLRAAGKSQETLARELGLGANRLSAMRTGTKGWPSFRTFTTLRAYVPPRSAKA